MSCSARSPAQYGNVKIDRFHGLLVDFCAANGITAVVKGLRAVSDFEYEMQMAQMNYRMAKIETLFMTTNPLYSFLSSSLIKEIARYGGDVSGLVPEPVVSQLRQPHDRGVRSAARAGIRTRVIKLGLPRAAGRLSARFRKAIHTSSLSCPIHERTRLAVRLSLTCARSAARPVPHGPSS